MNGFSASSAKDDFSSLVHLGQPECRRWREKEKDLAKGVAPARDRSPGYFSNALAELRRYRGPFVESLGECPCRHTRASIIQRNRIFVSDPIFFFLLLKFKPNANVRVVDYARRAAYIVNKPLKPLDR